MINGLYSVGNHNCRLRDLTIKQSRKVAETMDRVKAGKDTLRLRLTNDESAELMALLLESVEPGAQVDFEEMKESVVVNVIKDFFLLRIQLSENTGSSSKQSMPNSPEPETSTNP